MKKFIFTLLFACICSLNINASTINLKNSPSDSISFCKAITNSGSRCKRTIKDGKEYCWQHETSSSNSTSRCHAITKSGSKCKRNAKSGTNYCWQHQK